jgi:hypothetical protein
MAKLIINEYRNFFNSYIECLLCKYNNVWDTHYGCKNISTTALIELNKECNVFYESNKILIHELGIPFSVIAECFCLNEYKDIDTDKFILFNTGNKEFHIEDSELHITH